MKRNRRKIIRKFSLKNGIGFRIKLTFVFNAGTFVELVGFCACSGIAIIPTTALTPAIAPVLIRLPKFVLIRLGFAVSIFLFVELLALVSFLTVLGCLNIYK